MSDQHEPLRGAFSGLDLSLCEREPIHIPGAIQPHGALIAARADGLLVSHASANLATILGRPADSMLGRPLQDAIGEAACRILHGSLRRDGIALGKVFALPGPKGSPLHLHAHRSNQTICVDIEPRHIESGPRSPIIMAQSVLETFNQATSRAELCELAVRGLKAITRFDRVLAYRFGHDGHGEVIAEARAARLQPYLGLRYPASDIPPQARRQYLLHPVGAIADASYQPVPLLADPALDNDTPLDLTHSTLRSVSPVHREYMRNMKTAASLTIGLSHEQELWGMLVCHHATPRVVGPELRAVAAMIGQVVSLMLGSLGEAERYAQQLQRLTDLRTLIARLASPLPLAEALAASAPELIQLVDAGGALVRISGALFCVGQTPPQPEAERALAVLLPAAGGDVLAVDDVSLRHRELAGCVSLGSGTLLLPLGQGGDEAILWFRPELSRTLTWGGNPAEHSALNTETGLLAPRNSFAAWTETVKGHSTPWSPADLALARDLRIAIADEVAQRTKGELARLRHYDSLTGLPNRSLLLECLAEAEHDPGTALLFLDLDRFKAVNDTWGHAAGDTLLVEVARRLLACVGPGNLTARLGGDEFVVLCRGLDQVALMAISELVRVAIEAPFEIAGHSCHISASIGIAMADQLGGDLVRAADMAMYAAKQCGGNRGMVYEPSLHDRAARQFELDRELREALGRDDQLILVYQPLFSVAAATRKLAGFEALLRWRHPRHGWMAPNLFVPLAEKSGLILPLGEWVLATALRQGRMFQQSRPDANLRLAVNISALQLAQPNFCSGLADVLQAEGVPPSALCLEVTESILTDVAAAYVLADIRKLGVHVAVDDFGIGYSSLSYIRRLPVDIVKLDRSFLENIEGDVRAVSFISAVIMLAHSAGMSVVMEGIETQAQLETALAAGADVVQGFLLATPLSAEAAVELITATRARGEGTG
jgi:diguanylate cyclase (GGDEF)-like protein